MTSRVSSGPKEKRHYAWAVLAACCVFCFGFGMTANASGQFLVPVTSELGFGVGQFSLHMTLSGIVQVASMTMLSKVLEKADFRLLITGCYIVRLICSALMSTFRHLWQWYAASMISGLFGPPVVLVMPPIILNNWFVKKRGFAVGVAMTFSGLGGAVMNPVLAWIIHSFGWRTAYLANALLTGLIVLPFLIFVIRLKPSDKGLTPYGFEEQAAAADPEGPQAQSRESQDGRGVSRDEAVRSLSFIIMVVIFASTGFIGSFTQLLTPYGLSLGLSLSAAAILPSLNMTCNALSKLAMGAINDRFGGRVMIYSGLAAALAAMLLLLNGPNPLAGLFVGAFLAGTFLTVMTVSAPLLVHAVYGARDYSRIFIYLTLGQSLCISAGSSVIGFMFDYTGSYRLSFILGAVVTVMIMILTHLAFATSKKLVWH